MDDLRAAVGQLDRIEVVQFGDLHGVGENLRIGVQHAVHVLPHGHRLGVEDIGHHGRRVVRAFAPQRGGRTVGRTADKALSDKDILDALGQRALQQRSRSFDIDPGVLVTLLGEETAAHVDPAVRHSGIVEILRDNRRRDQLAEGHDRIVPQLGVGGFVNRFHGHALQLVEERIDPFELFMAAPQIVDDARMVLPQRGDMLHGELFVALLKSFEHLFERVGRLAHGRNDDEEILLVVDNLAQVAHSVGITHRRTAKFVNLHVISLFNLTYLLYRPKATGRRTPAAERRVERPPPQRLTQEAFAAARQGFRPDHFCFFTSL